MLATSIAETSLTLDGIRIVVDSGLARRPRYDRAAGMTRLVTERASQAAVTQRAGRAARQGPGVAYRLWEEAATAGLPRFDPPEILEADLSALMLDCALWGVADPRELSWLDPPPEAAVSEARRRLTVLEALDADGRPTPHGKAIARLPLPPRLGHMLVRAGEMGLAKTAAEVAVLLGERGLGGSDADLELRLRRWRSERGQRAENARRLAERWAKLVPRTPPLPNPLPASGERELEIATCIALAFPDRIARRRDGSGENWASVGGRGFRLDPASPLARAEWLAVAETQGMAAGARILSAAAIDFATIETLFGERIETRRSASFDPATGRVEAVRERRLGALRLSSGPDRGPVDSAALLLERAADAARPLFAGADIHRVRYGERDRLAIHYHQSYQVRRFRKLVPSVFLAPSPTARPLVHLFDEPQFNTVDVCVIVQTDAVTDKYWLLPAHSREYLYDAYGHQMTHKKVFMTIQAKIDELRAKQAEEQENVDALEHTLDDTAKVLKEVEQKVDSYEKEKAGREKLIRQLDDELQQLENQFQNMKNRLVEIEDELDLFQEDAEKYKERILCLQQEREEIVSQIQSKNDDRS